MKKTILFVLVLSTWTMADSSIKLNVTGMTCGGCASGINEGFAEDFLKYKVYVDYKSAMMRVKRKDGNDVNVKVIKEALEDMGFKGSLVN